MRPFRSLLLMMLLTPAVAGASITLRTEVTPREVTIGDRIQVRVTVTHSTDAAPVPFQFPSVMDQFEILDSRSTPSKQVEGKIQEDHTLVATTFSTGAVVLPAISFIFQLTDGTTTEARTTPVEIQVASVMEDGGKGGLRPMRGLIDFPSYLWVWWVLGIVGGLGLLTAISWYRKRKAAVLAAAPAQPPEIVAWDAIHALEDEQLVEKGEIKEFYSRLSIILRGYLESRFRITALESTTTELLSAFRKLQLSYEITEMARVFLDNADLAKFAKMTPEPQEISDDLTRVKQIINATTPKDEPKEAKKEEDVIPV